MGQCSVTSIVALVVMWGCDDDDAGLFLFFFSFFFFVQSHQRSQGQLGHAKQLAAVFLNTPAETSRNGRGIEF